MEDHGRSWKRMVLRWFVWNSSSTATFTITMWQDGLKMSSKHEELTCGYLDHRVVRRHCCDTNQTTVRNPFFGLPGLSSIHQQQADDDSVLWIRNLWWMWMNKVHHPKAKNLIEQPRDPNEWYQGPGEEQDLYPSFLRWQETKKRSVKSWIWLPPT